MAMLLDALMESLLNAAMLKLLPNQSLQLESMCLKLHLQLHADSNAEQCIN